MISSNEIYYLNRALDGKEIYGIDPMENLVNALNSKKTAKESLIDKNILAKDGRINDASYLLIEGLEKYKTAKEYLWVNSRVIAIDDSNYLIHLEKNKNKDIVLKKITKSIMLYSIIRENSFLWGNNIVQGKREYIPVKDFVLNKINAKDDEDVLYIKKEIQGSQRLYNIYYKENDDLFKYDVLNELLEKVNPRDIRIELVKVFNMDWGENIG